LARISVFEFAAVTQNTGGGEQQAADDELRAVANELFDPVPSIVPAAAGNPLTWEKTELGKVLWFAPRLSASGVLSCNSCHNLAMGGDNNLGTSIGHGWQHGPRNSTPVFNAGSM
jgi:cytochrome c peroxidase